MKSKTTIWTTLLASVCCLLLYACTGAQEDLERLNAASQDVDSRTSKMVTAEVILTETSTLQDKLIEKLGSDKSTTVQDLKISGLLKAQDVEFLHELKSLEKLDMTGTVMSTSWPNYYYINYSGNSTVYGYLYDNQIGNYMFAGMTSLKEILIPETITTIGYCAFSGCTSLTSVPLPNTVTGIDNSAFSNCISLTTITLPAALNSISNNAFYNAAITSLDVPEGITSISGFNDCPKLKTVTLPSTLKEIGSSAFSNCPSLESLTIPGNVETIESYAFSSSGLTEIDIPASVQELGNGVFNDCDKLTKLIIPATVTQVRDYLVSNCDNLQALVWETSIAVPNSQPNEQCFLYINSHNGATASYEPSNWKNVVIDGIAESIQLTHTNYVSSLQQVFSCPIPFKAKNISLTMSFYNDWNARWTYEGRASGWRTIVLPFKVTSVTSELKGALAPFDSDQEGTKPFWLRSLTADGFVNETSIKANKPYIIAMPYNPDIYLDEYNIYGNVVFTGENVDVEVTPNPLIADEGAEYFFQPTYQYVNKSGNIYALNYDYSIRNHDYGSVFAGYSANIYPYEAYLMPKPGSETRALFEIDARPVKTRSVGKKNATGIPAIGDM